MSIEKLAKFQLSLFYGNKDNCIKALTETKLKYENCKGKNNPKVIDRIAKYDSVIDYLNKN